MRTLVLIDGQNLYHLAKNAWSSVSDTQYTWPSYDVEKLARTLVAVKPERILTEIRFYTGVHKKDSDPFWHGFWSNKLRYLRSQGIQVYRGRINNAGKEKGVDVRLALDLIRATYEQNYDVAVIVSQDNDFAPAVRLAKDIARQQRRWITLESAFPVGPGSSSANGIPGTEAIHIDKATYDACHDPVDYRPQQ